MLRLAADENFNNDIVRGVLRGNAHVDTRASDLSNDGWLSDLKRVNPA